MMGESMTIPQSMICNCVRCSHQWIKRISGRPKRCPNCKEHDWDVLAGQRPRGRPTKNAAKGKMPK
jgi:hypothetical protein